MPQPTKRAALARPGSWLDVRDTTWADYVNAAVDELLPLTPEQVDRITVLLDGAPIEATGCSVPGS